MSRDRYNSDGVGDLPLFMEGAVEAPSNRVSDMSIEAAWSLVDALPAMRRVVFDTIHEAGARGMTCDEVEVALDGRHQTVSARLNELSGRYRRHPVALIRRSGERRLTRSGRYADVWVDAVASSHRD